MTIDTYSVDEAIAEVEDVLARLRVSRDAVVTPMALPGNVAAGELITSAWGNSVTNAVNRLFTYGAVRIATTTNVSTNANGDFAITTGFQPTAAICISNQPTNPAYFVLRDPPDNVQVVFRAFNPAGGIYANAIIAVSYAIFGAPVVP